MTAAPTPASLASAASSPDVDPVVLDGLVNRWLLAEGRLEPEADTLALPSWQRASAAHRLADQLLPGWRLELPGATTATLTPPAGVSIATSISADGPDLARAILAAAFYALVALEQAEPEPMEELRAAMGREMADG